MEGWNRRWSDGWEVGGGRVGWRVCVDKWNGEGVGMEWRLLQRPTNITLSTTKYCTASTFNTLCPSTFYPQPHLLQVSLNILPLIFLPTLQTLLQSCLESDTSSLFFRGGSMILPYKKNKCPRVACFRKYHVLGKVPCIRKSTVS